MSLSDACDEILSSGILSHEYGIPKLWPRTAPMVQKPHLESEYYDLNKQLLQSVDRLLFLNRLSELNKAGPQGVAEQYAEAFDESWQNRSFDETQAFLSSMARFKTDHLTADFLTMALPVLRSIYQENTALTDAEFTILNNLKKLYSHYNEHPANIRHLLREHATQKTQTTKESALQGEIEQFLQIDMKPELAELEALNNEYLALKNTYENRLQERDSESSAQGLKTLKSAALTLSRRMQRISSLSEFLPNLMLCQVSNWYTDKELLAVMQECQDTSESLDLLPEPRRLRDVEEVMKFDFEGLEI